MEFLINNGVLWICEKSEDEQVSFVPFYVVFKHGEDDYGSWAFDLTEADFAHVGTSFTTLENLQPFLEDILKVFYYYGGSSRGSLEDEIGEFEQYNEHVIIDELSSAEFKKILETELTCVEI